VRGIGPVLPHAGVDGVRGEGEVGHDCILAGCATAVEPGW
jgi:hypothetical protein